MTALSCLVVAWASVLAIGHAAPSILLSDYSLNEVTVKLHVFSGSHHPEWNITRAQYNQVQTLLVESPQYQPHIMGYTGFSLAIDDKLIYGNMLAELFLLGTIPSSLGLSRETLIHIMSRIASFTADIATRHKFAAVTYRNESHLSEDCNTLIKGPDTVPAYNPASDNGGCFIQDEGQNNCYNYGNDILTNTFAQPGRGSGAKWTANTCEDITASAERDGLRWVGKTLPTAAPESGHYVALLIWPNTNFHWVRLDADGKWSHKPGGSPVRNVDDDGKEITDPSLSNFSPWTQFCGYFQSVPSIVNID